MMATILIAAEKGAYTITDRDSYLSYKKNFPHKKTLLILSRGGKILQNQYSIIPINPLHCKNVKRDLTDAFARWMTAPKTQKLIKNFRNKLTS